MRNIVRGGIEPLDPVILDDPSESKGGQLEIRGDSKTVVEWINGKARQPTVQRQL